MVGRRLTRHISMSMIGWRPHSSLWIGIFALALDVYRAAIDLVVRRSFGPYIVSSQRWRWWGKRRRFRLRLFRLC